MRIQRVASRLVSLRALSLTVAMGLAGAASPGLALAAGTTLAIPKAPAAITVDGRISDWSSLGITPAYDMTVQGTSTGFRAKSRLAYDDKNLYLSTEVSDKEITAADDLSRDFAGSDAVRLYISSDPVTGFGSGRFKATDYVFIVTPTSLYQKPLKTVYGYGGYEHLDLDLTKVKVAARPTESGYTLEMSVPWRELKIEPKPGLTLALQVVAINASTQGQKTFAALAPVTSTDLESTAALAQTAVLE